MRTEQNNGHIFDFQKRISCKRLPEFAELLLDLSRRIGFKVSARGWCYLMEQAGYIDKSQFGKIEDTLNRCRKEGFLPVDFVAEETARAFSGIVTPSNGDVTGTLRWILEDVLTGHGYFVPNYWEDEQYYIQVVVEKTDLVTLFGPVCEEYNIPIANAKGWSSILQRAEYARRFNEATERGLQCVLLYGGDFDADGLRISDTIRDNLAQVAYVRWDDDRLGYDPINLHIERFCLSYDFIRQHSFTWIDNLITGSGKDLASPNHPNHFMPYVQNYLKAYGPRKCEANVLVTSPAAARALIRSTIERYLGVDALDRFRGKRKDWKGLMKRDRKIS